MLINGYDVVAIAPKNSGKFLLPALIHTSNRESHADGPLTLILTNHCERIDQIANHIQKFGFENAKDYVCVTNKEGEIESHSMETFTTADWNLKKILIAHPEALWPLLEKDKERRINRLKEVTFVAIDHGKSTIWNGK